MAQGLWVDEAETLPSERQTYLTDRLTVAPDVKQGIYPFKNIKLTRADVAWLLKTHEYGRGHVDWHDERQRQREGLDLRGANLEKEDLHDLPLVRMRGGLAENVWLEATIEEREQAAVHLEDADLHGAHLEGADLSMAHLEGADLRTAHLEGADLRMARLQEANLSGTDLEDARLTGAILQRAYLRAARLGAADLREAHLEGARIFQAHLQDADLRGAFLLGADLRGAFLLRANLHEVKLDQADLRGAVLTEDQKELLRDSKVIGLDETKDRLASISRDSAEPPVFISWDDLLVDTRHKHSTEPPVVGSLEDQLENILQKHVEMVIAGHPLEETLTQLVQGACKLAEVPSALGSIRIIRVIDPDTLILQQDVLGNGMVFPGNIPLTMGITWRAASQRRWEIVNDVNSDPDYIRADVNVRSEMAGPLLINDRCWGILNLESYEPGHFHEGLLPWIRILASQAVLTIQHDTQRQRLDLIRTTNKDIEVMLHEQHINSMRRAPERVLRKLVNAALVQTGSQFGSIMAAVQIPDGPGRIEKNTKTELVLLVAQPQNEKLDSAQHFPVTEGLVGEAYRTGQLKFKDVNDYSVELAVPLYIGDRVSGVLSLKSMKSTTYSTEQLAWAELIASQIANVLSSAQLHLLRRQLVGVLQVGREMMLESLSEDEGPINRALLRRILRTALDLTEQPDGYASAWLTYDNELRRYEFFTNDESTLGKDVVDATTGSVVEMVRAHQTPVLALDVTEPPWSENIVRNWPAIRSELAVPLLDLTRPEGDSRRVVGVLNIESRRKFDFNERDIEILELLAQVIFTAMHFRDIYRSKTILLRDITHAFEKAIWPLRICAEELRRQPFDPTQAGFQEDEYKEKAAEIASLTDLAGNLLDWFQQLVEYEDGNAAIDSESTSMEHLVQQIVDRMTPFAHNEDKQIKVVTPPEDFKVKCAPDLVKAALFLLIENALTYSPENDTIFVNLHRLPKGGARIEVADHGLPVPAPERNLLFNAGFRGSAADAALMSGRTAGSGLGLDHVRRIIEKLHHGKVGYNLLEDKNCFYIELPPGSPVRGKSPL